MESIAVDSLSVIEQWNCFKESHPEDNEDVDIFDDYILDRLQLKDGIELTLSGDEDWFNVSERLNLSSDLNGKVVVLDFFTYCCINCLHVLPALHALERRFPVDRGLVVIGVHSAKFGNERLSGSIASALRRYDVTHPVVNDADLVLWNQLSVSCWPTLLVLGPARQPLLTLVGEAHIDLLPEFVAAALRLCGQQLSRRPLPLAPSIHQLAASEVDGASGRSLLLFPGSLCRLDAGRLVVADTGHHRLLVVDADSGAVLLTIGGPDAGLRDGRPDECRFHSPQGVAAADGVVYVADTENHAVRKVDMSDGAAARVSTLVTASPHSSAAVLEEQSQQLPVLCSPWDVCVVGADQLFIAMAGVHQIWMYALKETQLFRKPVSAAVCVLAAGTGEEGCRNNLYPHRASFAQPSGLAHCPLLNCLLVADSESSSVRQMSLRDGAVRPVVGGSKDPTDLFAFGDVDCSNPSWDPSARLQHPLAVAWSETRGAIYISDSYNHKLKRVQTAGKRFSCVTLTGADKGDCIGTLQQARFDEPGGLCMNESGDILYVADTNNHSIRRVDLHQLTVQTLDIRPRRSDTPDRGRIQTTDTVGVVTSRHHVTSAGGRVALQLDFTLPGATLTDGAPHSWQVTLPDDWSADIERGPFSGRIACVLKTPPLDGSTFDLPFLLRLFLCSPVGVCYQLSIQCHLVVNGDTTAITDVVKMAITLTPEQLRLGT